MIGDRESDLIPAKKLGLSTIQVTAGESSSFADYVELTFLEAVEDILKK